MNKCRAAGAVIHMESQSSCESSDLRKSWPRGDSYHNITRHIGRKDVGCFGMKWEQWLGMRGSVNLWEWARRENDKWEEVLDQKSWAGRVTAVTIYKHNFTPHDSLFWRVMQITDLFCPKGNLHVSVTGQRWWTLAETFLSTRIYCII